METVQVEVNDDLLKILDAENQDVSHQLKLWTVMALYDKGKISLGKAASILGLDKWDFADVLNEHGYPVFNTSIEDLQKDIEYIRKKYPDENK